MSTSTRPHGYARYKLDNCRCYTCGYANSAYTMRRDKLIAYGQWQPYIDAEPVRAHMGALSAAGIGWKRVSVLADVATSTLCALLYGKPGRQPTKRIRPDIAAAILAVELETATVAAGQLVPAIGTQRRIKAMVADGWTLTIQAEQFGWSIGSYYQLLHRDEIRKETAEKVAALYAARAAMPRPAVRGANHARKWAREHECFPSIAWDDDTIDDPDALPSLLPPVDSSDLDVDDLRIQKFAAGFVITLGWREKLEVVHRMPGRAPGEIAELIGVSRKSVMTMRSMHPSRRLVAA